MLADTCSVAEKQEARGRACEQRQNQILQNF